MLMQICISLKDSEKERLNSIVEKAKITKVGIFRAGMETIEKQLKNEGKK